MTPRFFVHVRFFPEHNEDNTYFVAGQAHPSSSNRIIGLVRTSANRSKRDFDDLAEAIEVGWYSVLGMYSPEEREDWTDEEETRRLIMVTFTPMVALREAGMEIPEAGHDREWLEEQSFFIQTMANNGVPGFSGLLEEVKHGNDAA
jgi:hypothetical protein